MINYDNVSQFLVNMIIRKYFIDMMIIGSYWYILSFMTRIAIRVVHKRQFLSCIPLSFQVDVIGNCQPVLRTYVFRMPGSAMPLPGYHAVHSCTRWV